MRTLPALTCDIRELETMNKITKLSQLKRDKKGNYMKYTNCPATKRKHSSKTKTVTIRGQVVCEVCGKYLTK